MNDIVIQDAKVTPVDPSTWPEWTKRCPFTPRQHQVEGVQTLLTHDKFLLADDVGGGKTMQCIDTAQLLFEINDIEACLVVGPAYARGVWADPSREIGEIVRHSWPDVPFACREYSVNSPDIHHPRGLHSNTSTDSLKTKPFLRWMITNYEFIRRIERLGPLLGWAARRRFMLICDEAWALSDQGTAQWKAVHALRKLAKRIVLLNGTPVSDTPLDLNAQIRLLDPRILGFPYMDRFGREKWSNADGRFRARYAVFQPNTTFPRITGWQNLEELRAKVAPYALRRMTEDCFDLPPVLEPILVEVTLHESWPMYCQMRDDMVAWLDGTQEASVAKQAIVKGLRLAQITSGFLGGVQQLDLDADMITDLVPADITETRLVEVGREKLDTLLVWLKRHDTHERMLIWSRFRPEIERTARELAAFRTTFKLYGEQSAADREAAKAALNPNLNPGRPVAVVGSRGAGGAALNLAGASLEINLSYSFLLREYLQARGRTRRPGQTKPLQRVDFVAKGPKGQRTIDHHILASIRGKDTIANWTSATWRHKLLEE